MFQKIMKQGHNFERNWLFKCFFDLQMNNSVSFLTLSYLTKRLLLSHLKDSKAYEFVKVTFLIGELSLF